MSPQLLQQIYGYSKWMGDAVGRLSPARLLLDRARMRHVDDGRVARGLVAVAMRCPQEDLEHPVRPRTVAAPAGDDRPLPLDRVLALLLGGTMLLWLSVRFKTRWLLAGLLLVAPVYVGVRLTNLWTGQQAVDLAKAVIGPDRAQSLEYRFTCENLLAARALQQPLFGWGTWGRSDAYFFAGTEWKKKVQTDGMWIIILGTKGFVGLTLFYVTLVLPAFLFVWRFPARLWGDPRLAAGSLAAGLLGVYMVDCLLNSYINIVYITLAGGLSSLELRHLRAMPGAGHGVEAAGRRPVGGALGRPRPGSRPPVPIPAPADRPGGSLPHPGAVVQAGRAAARGGGCLEAGPRPARRPPRSQSRRRRSAAAVVRLRQRPGLAVGQSPRSVPPRPGVRRVDGPPGGGRVPRGPGLLEHAGGRPLPRRRRPLRRSTPSIAPGPWAADGLRRRLPGHGACAAGRPRGSPAGAARAMLQAERDYPGHPELAGFCDEARSILAGDTGAPVAVR